MLGFALFSHTQFHSKVEGLHVLSFGLEPEALQAASHADIVAWQRASLLAVVETSLLLSLTGHVPSRSIAKITAGILNAKSQEMLFIAENNDACSGFTL
jgi:hypothetical protein